jgi:hypothetical protein
MTRHVSGVLAAVVAFGLILAGCGGGDPVSSGPAATPATPATTAVVDPESCDEVTGLFTAASVLDPLDGSCGRWVEMARGRAVEGSTGSASLWSRRTGHGTALVVGAVHTLGQGWFGPENTAVPSRLVDPGAETGVLRLFLAHRDGSGPDALATPWYRLYNPAIAAERNGNLMQDLLPREDFYVAVADSQKHDVDELPYPVPGPIVLGEVPVYDPGATTLAAQTFAPAEAGDIVLLLGFPNQTGELSASVGRVLSAAEAEQAIADLAAAGDPEGGLSYDADVEIIIQGAAASGMSGGPVVDGEGRLVAVMVRASGEHAGFQYVRAVRMTHIAAELRAAFEALPADGREAIRGYLEG